jgi:hypothetical protein
MFEILGITSQVFSCEEQALVALVHRFHLELLSSQ